MRALTRRYDLATLFAIAALGLGVAGCQVMDSTRQYEVRPDGSRAQKCSSALGSYSLPYSTINFKVQQSYDTTTNAPVGPATLAIDTPQAHPDSRHVYCLDFLESPFSTDVVQVAYAGKIDNNASATNPTYTAGSPNGLLAAVISKNIDQTGEIIRNFIRAIFVLVSGNADSSFGRDGRVAGQELRIVTEQAVNPFDLAGLAQLNRSLSEYGFCITLGKYTHDTDRISAGEYCDHPERSLDEATAPRYAVAARDQDYLVDKLPVGLFYRPRQPYDMFVYVRDDPELGLPWQLRKVDTVMLENISPIISLGITRSAFAERKVAFAFDNGVLLDVCLAKGSEIQGALQVPLDIIYGLVSLPTATITAEIALKNGQIDLLEKQRDVIDAQNKLLDYKVGGRGTAVEQTGKPLTAGDLNFADGTKRIDTTEAIGKIPTGTNLSEVCKILNM